MGNQKFVLCPFSGFHKFIIISISCFASVTNSYKFFRMIKKEKKKKLVHTVVEYETFHGIIERTQSIASFVLRPRRLL